MIKHVNKLKTLSPSQFEDYLDTINSSMLKKIKRYSDDKYYNDNTTPFEDWQYDMITERLPQIKSVVGSKLREDELEVKLPFWLGSMDKAKPKDTDIILKWVQKYPSFFIMSKLDGISCLLKIKEGNITLYTRGNGTKGKDITYVAPYINYIPKVKKDLYIRGELIMNQKNFSKLSSVKNARNTVSGLVKAKISRKGIEDIDFVAYEILNKGKNPDLIEQLNYLDSLGFRTVKRSNIININDTIHPYFFKEKNIIESLSNFLNLYRDKDIYDIDGIICHTTGEYIRNTSGNPKYSIAYKKDTEIESTVVDVLWDVTKSGFLKPRVKIEPVFLSGATITYATGYNAAFIRDNKIGPNSVITLTRSGEVIPRILNVIKSTKSKMPDISYTWGDTDVDIYTENIEDNNVTVKKLNHFIKSMGILNISESTITKLVNNGYNTIKDIISLTVPKLKEIEGIQEKGATRIYESIQSKLKDVELSSLMAGSDIFGHGIGKKKLDLLLSEIPDILYNEMDQDFLYARIINIESFSDKTVKKIIDNLPLFKRFYDDIKDIIKLQTIEVDENDDMLKDDVIVMTGFRDKSIENFVKSKGGRITSAISGKTTILLIKDNEFNSSKVQKAKELKINIQTQDEFVEKYMS